MEKPAPSYLSTRDDIVRSIAPLIAVTASEDAEELCRINHIPSFADFIKPFGDMIEGRVTARDWQGVPIHIDNFNIRFKPIHKLDEPNHQAVMKFLEETVRAKGEQHEDLMEEIRNKADVTEDYLNTPLNDLTPWYVEFKNTILSLRGITEYETFDHPVATMIVISSTDPDPVSTIMQLYNPNVPSFTIDKPYVDTNVLRYYVILHDSNLTTLEHSMAVFEKLKRTVGLHCFLLKINSKPRDPADNESIEDKTEDDIRAIWEESLSETYRIESLLQNYTADLSSTSSVVGLDATINPSATISPASSTPGHSRSASVSSNRSSNNATPVPPATVIHGTSIQSIPIDLLDENLEQMPPVSPLPLLSEATTIQYGRCLTRGDVDNVKTMIRELTVQSLIPFMERNIQHWNEQVASARRGLTGRLFGASRRLFGSSVRSPTPQSVQSVAAQGPNVPFGVNTITIYPASSPEAQMRKLADYAFMLRDYKFAHTIYDTVRRDYATEKIYKYHAGTQEMMGVCVLLMSSLQTNKTDVDRHFELAIQQYLGRCRSPFHATRATIIYYELLKSRRMWKEMPTALVRMTGEDSDLRSGLFLEQAAHCFLRMRHPMVRKYGFHLVMAGHRYGKAGQRLHAYRAYKMAAFVLEGHDWSLAQSHIQFALGRQAFHLGRLEDAVACFSNVLSDNVKQTGQQQGAHMREFLFIYRQYAMSVGLDPLKVSLPHLTLPVIDDRDIQVTLSNAQPKISQKEEWADMELAMLEDSINYGYISSSKRAMAVQQQDDHIIVCAVGEPAIVHIELYNPLQVSILLSDIMLGCQYRTSTEVEKSTTSDASEEMPECKQKELNSDMYDFENFSLQKLDKIKLEPLEKMMINLTIVPHNEGSIQVAGLHYTLNELVHTFRPFSKKGRRLNKTKEELMSVTYAADRSLDILVTSPMPLLDLAFHHVPETILSGEVIQAVLEINNKGNKGLTALRLKTSHPSFICVGNPEDMDKDIYSMNGTTPDKMDLDNQLFDSSIITIPLPARKDQEHSHEHGIVLPGETTLVPLWIRGDRIGKHTFKFLFSYQSNEDNAMIAHRTLRYTMNIQVLPSLKINAFTRPSTTAVNEYILGIEIENLQTAARFDLTQLTIASPSWALFPLSIDMDSSEDMVAKTTIPPRQTTFSFYKLRRLEQGDDSCPEAWTSTALGKLLNAPDTKSKDLPPPIQLNISKLSFREHGIPFHTVPLKTFAMNSRMQWRQGYLEGQFPSISRESYNSLFTLFATHDIDISLYWHIPDMNRYGHHYIIGINLGTQQNPFQGTASDLVSKTNGRTMFEATAKERELLIKSLTRNRALKDESPIKIMVSLPDKKTHDFEKDGLLKVTTTISLINCSWNRTSNYLLELLPWSDQYSKASKQSNKTTSNKVWNLYPFHWTGVTVFSGTLKPDEKIEIEAFASFHLAGVYDINRWKLTVRTIDNKEDPEVYVHYPSLPQLITTIAA